jgi:hypothetical protein
LLSYGVDGVEIYRRAASYVDRILRGEKPGDLPVQFPTKFEMVVNRKTATALGLEVPLSILLRADEVTAWPLAARAQQRLFQALGQIDTVMIGMPFGFHSDFVGEQMVGQLWES